MVETQRQVTIKERHVPLRSGGKVNILSVEEAEELRLCASGCFPMWQSEEGDNDDEGDIVEDSYDIEDDSDEEGNVNEEDEIPKSPNNGIPINNELLLSFESHVAHYIWDGFDRGVLSCHSRVHRVQKWSISSLSIIVILKKTGLFHLKDCMYKYLDAPLISAFVERWQPETNSFHLPFGEMIVTLHDVWYILRVPVMGKPLIEDDLNEEHVKELKGKLALLLGVDMSEVKKQWHKGTVHFDFIHKNLRAPNNSHDFVARGYLLWLLRSILFVDKIGIKYNCHFLSYLDNLEDVNNHAWGAATLAYLYRQLGVATRVDTRQICSCLTMLQKRGLDKRHAVCLQVEARIDIKEGRDTQYGTLDAFHQVPACRRSHISI